MMNKRKQKLTPLAQDIYEDLRSGSSINSAFAPMMKRVMEAVLEGELEEHLDHCEAGQN